MKACLQLHSDAQTRLHIIDHTMHLLSRHLPTDVKINEVPAFMRDKRSCEAASYCDDAPYATASLDE